MLRGAHPDDWLLQRNAALIVILRHTIAQLHHLAEGHTHRAHWMACPHEDCRKARTVIGDSEVDSTRR